MHDASCVVKTKHCDLQLGYSMSGSDQIIIIQLPETLSVRVVSSADGKIENAAIWPADDVRLVMFSKKVDTLYRVDIETLLKEASIITEPVVEECQTPQSQDSLTAEVIGSS